MKNFKSLSLVLALPLLLWACDKPKPDPVVETETPMVEVPVLSEAVVETENDSEPEPEPESEAEIVETAVEAEIQTETEVVEATPEPIVIEETVELEVAEPEPVVETGLNGEFSYDTKYGTPKGVTDLTTTFSVANGVITNVSLAGNPAHRTSVEYQVLFEAKVKDLIVGKEIAAAGAAPNKVNGSSLTAVGFNSALEKLQNEG